MEFCVQKLVSQTTALFSISTKLHVHVVGLYMANMGKKINIIMRYVHGIGCMGSETNHTVVGVSYAG